MAPILAPSADLRRLSLFPRAGWWELLTCWGEGEKNAGPKLGICLCGGGSHSLGGEQGHFPSGSGFPPALVCPAARGVIPCEGGEAWGPGRSCPIPTQLGPALWKEGSGPAT